MSFCAQGGADLFNLLVKNRQVESKRQLIGRLPIQTLH